MFPSWNPNERTELINIYFLTCETYVTLNDYTNIY